MRRQLLDLVNRQQQAEQRQQLAEQALLEERGHRQATQARLDQQRAAAVGMVDTRLLGKPEKWDGTDRAWKDRAKAKARRRAKERRARRKARTMRRRRLSASTAARKATGNLSAGRSRPTWPKRKQKVVHTQQVVERSMS